MIMPHVGDPVGTNPTDATVALDAIGCKVWEFEPEDGRIEAKSTDAENREWEVDRPRNPASSPK